MLGLWLAQSALPEAGSGGIGGGPSDPTRRQDLGLSFALVQAYINPIPFRRHINL